MEKRLRLREIEVRQLPDSGCEAHVLLEWRDGLEIPGAARGTDTPAGVLRCAAEATVNALGTAVGGKVDFNLLGVKSISAFDAMVVVVSLAGKYDNQSQRLVGSCIIKGQPSRAVAMAVLSATNRLMDENAVYLR